MDPIRTELERLYQLVTSEAEVAAQSKLRRQFAELEDREQALAAAMELASVDPRIRAAFHDGIAEERLRCICLIDQRLEVLAPSSITATVLRTLRQVVEGKDA